MVTAFSNMCTTANRKLRVHPSCIIKRDDSLGRDEDATSIKRLVLSFHELFLSFVNTVEGNLPEILGN